MNDSKEISVDEVSSSLNRFGIMDYIVFGFMLVLCSLIGIYFGYQDHKKKQKKDKSKPRRGSDELEYLVGGRNMQIFPVAMSLVASGLSGIALLGLPSEVYFYGINQVYILLTIWITYLFAHHVVIPIFYNLEIVSTYEYLRRRFDNKVRLFGSLLFLVTNVLYLPIVIYVPALAFNQTTGINVHVISVFVCIICIFYTLLGGIKAVVWTDFIQVILIVGSLIFVVTLGVYNVGGFSVLFERNLASGRLDTPELGFDLFTRDSAIALFIGGNSFMLNNFATGQAMVQRYMSLPSIEAARKALVLNLIAIVLIISMCCFTGLIAFAVYHDCDPLTTKLVTAKDQLLPLLLMQNMSHIPGFAGLFIAGVFSASLSTLSTALNSAAAVVLEDFWKPVAKTELSERKTSYIMRATVFIFGIISVLLVVVVQKLGGVMQLGISALSASFGPLFGLFFIGFFLPWIKAKGAFIGSVMSFIISMYIIIRSQADIASGDLYYGTKPTSVEGCTYNFVPMNTTTHVNPEISKIDSTQLHHISFFYYSFLGSAVTIIVGYIVTFICQDTDPSTVDLNLLAPCIRKYFKQNELNICEGVKLEETKHVFDVKGNHLKDFPEKH